jgi:NADPH:quinone reductase
MPNSVPTFMRAATISHFGSELRTEEIAVPELAPDEILIRVESAGVGSWDPGEREGRYSDLFQQLHGTEPSFPYVIGFEGAGTVAAIGDAVSGFRVGDRVYADRHLNPKGGFYAEFAAVQAPYVHPIPIGLSMPEAGAMPVDAITALLGLTDVLGVAPGESLLIFGASGGLGHLALQLAKRLGARVFAVASGRDGVTFAQRLGADATIDGRTDDVLAAASEFAPEGIDAALLTAGGHAAQTALRALRDGGRAAYPRGIDAEPTEQPGFTLERYIGDNPPASRSDQLGNLISAAPFEVHVAQTFALDQADDAHRALGEHHLGKLALQLK